MDDESSTTELHTDPMEQGFSLSELNKQLRNNSIIISIAMLLFLGMMSSIYFFSDTNLPIIRLADIEQNPKLTRETDYNGNGKEVDWGGYHSFSFRQVAFL